MEERNIGSYMGIEESHAETVMYYNIGLYSLSMDERENR